MTGRLVDVESRIDTVHKLSAVISAMRGIAAARVQEAQHHLASIRAFSDTIGGAIGQALALMPATDRAAPGPAGPGSHAIVAFCAEQGFAGAFSDRILTAAQALIAQDPTRRHDLLIVGDRGLLAAETHGLAVAWSAPMIAHPDQAAALADRITEALYRRMTEEQLVKITVICAQPDGPDEGMAQTRQLLPFDLSRFALPVQATAPRIALPAPALLARLVEEYVFAELSEAVMLSFAAENRARMRAMIAAQSNVNDTLDGLITRGRQLRQQEITDEIVELAMGSLNA
jgi:F-type H+-transporting ATPase subunit gamma